MPPILSWIFHTSLRLTTLTYIRGVLWDLINVCKSLRDTGIKGATKQQYLIGRTFKSITSAGVNCQFPSEVTEAIQFISACSSNQMGFIRGQTPVLLEKYCRINHQLISMVPILTEFLDMLYFWQVFVLNYRKVFVCVFLTSVWQP